MAGTDIYRYKDTSVNHDHTYYGKGCSNGWDSGSRVSCSIETVTTFDSEIQDIGTYYTFQASSVGSANTEPSEDFASVPDTFCPLGWQLPYDGTGGDYYNKSKSWKYLFGLYGIDDSTAGIHKLDSYPTSYVMNGMFNINYGEIYVAGMNGFYWSSSLPTSKNNGYAMNTWGTAVKLAKSDYRLNGDALRCVTRY